MKFIATADLHIHDKCPENRIGDYFGQALNKFEQILSIAKKEKAYLLIAGDCFDSPSVSYEVVKKVVSIINKYKVLIYAIPGQHDMRYHHSGLENTPFGLLCETGHFNYLNKKAGFLTGAPWGEEPKEEAAILLLHKMVTEDGPLWYGQENFISAKELLKRYSQAKIIITGDNHLPHLVKYSNRYQINCGSMMRSSKDQINYKPSVWKIDIEESDFVKFSVKIDQIFLDIEPAENVFDFNKIQKTEIQKELKEEAQKKIEAFIKTLPATEQEKPNFNNSLKSVINSMKPSDRVQTIVNSIMEKCSNE